MNEVSINIDNVICELASLKEYGSEVKLLKLNDIYTFLKCYKESLPEVIEVEKQADSTNPTYYTYNGKSSHEFCNEQGFYIGNAIKYLIRHDKKATPKLDIEKAMRNIDFYCDDIKNKIIMGG